MEIVKDCPSSVTFLVEGRGHSSIGDEYIRVNFESNSELETEELRKHVKGLTNIVSFSTEKMQEIHLSAKLLTSEKTGQAMVALYPENRFNNLSGCCAGHQAGWFYARANGYVRTSDKNGKTQYEIHFSFPERRERVGSNLDRFLYSQRSA